MENIQIPITENGTATLATAGKYCDRNIDVQVEVPTFEAELEKEKAVEDGLLTNSLTEYFNDRITTQIRANGFRDLPKLQVVKVPRASVNGTNTFCNCTSLKIVECEREVGHQTFNSCNALNAVVILGTTRTNMWTTNSFYASGIEAGTGFIFAAFVLTAAFKRLNSQDVPASFRGFPATLVYLGIVSMAIYALF